MYVVARFVKFCESLIEPFIQDQPPSNSTYT